MEVFKDIPGYEGLYAVSNLGRVVSFKRSTLGHELKPRPTKSGYLRVNLSNNSQVKDFYIHRLVLCMFTNQPLDYELTVNHINKVKTDNRLENLEWMASGDNSRYSHSKPVAQYTLDGILVATYSSTKEAWNQTGINHGNISACCNNRHNHHTAGGYVWKYIGGDFNVK